MYGQRTRPHHSAAEIKTNTGSRSIGSRNEIKSVEEFAFPQDLESIVRQESYWEDESFEPLIILVEQVQYKGEEMLSYQVQFDLFKESGGMDGNQWEDMFIKQIHETEPQLLEFLKGDSESSTCVLWTNDQSNFKTILGKMIEVVEKEY